MSVQEIVAKLDAAGQRLADARAAAVDARKLVSEARTLVAAALVEPVRLLAIIAVVDGAVEAADRSAAAAAGKLEETIAKTRALDDGDAGRAGASAPPAATPRTVPQGLTSEQFRDAAEMLRDATDAIDGELRVQGSRAGYTARPDSDIDFAILVHKPRFDELIEQRFGTPNPGSAKERTKLWAIKTGKIQAGEAGLSPLRRQLESRLDLDVDLSVIRRGGQFDQPPYMGVPDRG